MRVKLASGADSNTTPAWSLGGRLSTAGRLSDAEADKLRCRITPPAPLTYLAFIRRLFRLIPSKVSSLGG